MSYNLTKFKKGILVFFLTAQLFSIYTAQTDNDNHHKYWYFKSRLNNDFVKVGLGQGESIPCQIRGKDNSAGSFIGDPNCNLAWGDASSYLGYYIAILATEYKLLKENNQDTKKTKHELFCALNAVNRIDYMAETFFNGNPNLNGYFFRDDVPENFIINNYEHFNYYNNGASPTTNNNLARGFMSKFNVGANLCESSLASWKTFTTNYSNSTISPSSPIPEMSQDQAISILYGLAFVKKFVLNGETDNGVNFGYGSNQPSLTIEAENIADRIIKHIRSSKNQAGNSCLANISTGWHIKNAVTCNPVGYNFDDNNPLSFGWGDDAEQFSYPLAEAGCVIKMGLFGGVQGQISLGNSYPRLCDGIPIINYHNTFSKFTGDNVWQILAKNVLPGNGDNRLHVVNLSAVCDCVYGRIEDKIEDWIQTYTENIPFFNVLGIVIKWVVNVITQLMQTFIPGYFINNTSTAINSNSYFGASDFDHAPLSRKILHGGFYQQNTDYSFDYLLNVAPCDNIYYLPNENPQYGHAQWSASDRIEHPRQRGGNIGDAVPSKGEYAGLDYLLYHNLWYIHQLQQSNNPNIEDLSNIYINKNGGLAPQASIYNAYETVTAENTVFNPNNNFGYMRAGKTIYFGPGTEIKTGTTNGGLHAYIQKFDCATDVGSFRLMNNGDSTQSSQTKGTEDTQPHYVSYPKDELTLNGLNEDEHTKNLITELAPDPSDALEQAMQKAYPEYSKELFIKPTLTSDVVKAYFTMDNDEYAFINILNMAGQNLYSDNYLGKERSGLSIDLSNLPAGTYLLKFTTTKGTSKSQKIIKQ